RQSQVKSEASGRRQGTVFQTAAVAGSQCQFRVKWRFTLQEEQVSSHQGQASTLNESAAAQQFAGNAVAQYHFAQAQVGSRIRIQFSCRIAVSYGAPICLRGNCFVITFTIYGIRVQNKPIFPALERILGVAVCVDQCLSTRQNDTAVPVIQQEAERKVPVPEVIGKAEHIIGVKIAHQQILSGSQQRRSVVVNQ